ncbi:MAG: amino acid permease, partial [Daejeonella sp.]
MNSAKHLCRTLGLFYVIGVVIANILGSGVYKKVAPMAAELNSSAWVLIAWITAGAITLIGALCNAEVAGLLADTGGEFVYYKKIYNRFFAFIFGWSLFAVIQTAAIASIAYVFAQSLDSILHFPPLFQAFADVNIAGLFYPFAGFSIKLTAILLIIFLSWVNTRGIKTGAGLSNGILLLVVIGIASIIVFGLSSSSASVSQSFNFSAANSTVSTSTFITAMLAAFWAYQGWYSIGFIGGEIKDVKKTLPKGVALGVIFVIAIYFLINTTYLSLLSIPDLNRIYAAGNEIAAVEAVRSFWGNSGALFISVLILITTFGCTHASILTGARPYYAMAKEGLFFPS